MNLIIVESPTKAKTLNRFLGKDYSVEATMGHIKDLPKSKLSVDVENDFQPDYQLVETRKKEIAKLVKQAKKAKKVYLATDPDREGEAIALHVHEIIGKTDYARITFHEITKEAVEEAIAHPAKIDDNLVNAQIARRVLDRLVGYKLSPVIWKKIRRGLSAGRVQTVVVRLIVEREREIEKFVKKEYWEIACDVKQQEKGKIFRVNLLKVDNKVLSVANGNEAKKLKDDLEKAIFSVKDVRSKEVRKKPFPPYTTSTLTQAGANVYGWSSKKTMSIAQKLYEEGLITYHRTDSTNLSVQAVEKVRTFIAKTYGDKYVPANALIYKTKAKSAQQAHEAIRPTDIKIQGDLAVHVKIKLDAEKLYSLIWRRFVACQMEMAIYDVTTIDVNADGNNNYLLRTTGNVEIFDGWRKVIPTKEKDELILPKVNAGEKLDVKQVISEQKFTQPPARFNEASLIKTLEKLGIGRPSTYAPTISTIQTRQYVEKLDKKFYPTPVGIAVTDFMVTNFDEIFDYSFTAGMENDLDEVAKGNKDWVTMMKDFYKPFEKKVLDVEKNAVRVAVPVEKTGRKCPTCKKEKRVGDKQGDLVIRTGRFGKFISCSNFPDCKHTEKLVVKVDMKCLRCLEEGRDKESQGDIIVKKTRTGRIFYGCSKYPECEYASWVNPAQAKDN
ncbi:type I DNA topoisomerase [Candidatus Woesebacteria bacterium]|nr:MAG: type I DNA topoisomerase [Candidatus Woesebacteria bacterium]